MGDIAGETGCQTDFLFLRHKKKLIPAIAVSARRNSGTALGSGRLMTAKSAGVAETPSRRAANTPEFFISLLYQPVTSVSMGP